MVEGLRHQATIDRELNTSLQTRLAQRAEAVEEIDNLREVNTELMEQVQAVRERCMGEGTAEDLRTMLRFTRAEAER